MNKKNRLRHFILLQSGLLVFSITCFSQDTTNTIGKVSIASPTAASLGKYGDIPVGYHTGTPNISVPIYTVKSGNLSTPISLSYHASGLKVQEQASWVGAGWSLNAGGAITRSVIGAADDRGYSSYQGYINSCTKGHYSDYGFNSYMVSGTDTTLYETQLAIADFNFRSGYSDGEPDMFFFNFGDYTGKFYFNDDRTPIIVPEQDLQIQPDFQIGPGFNGFTVTTPGGIKYYFGRTGNYSSPADPVESTIPSTSENGPSYASAAASSWFLNKIISADGTDSITFEYKSEKYSYYTWSMFPISDQNFISTTQQKNGVDLVKNKVNGVRLSKISFPYGNATFTPSSTARKDLSDNNYTLMMDVTNDSSYSLGSIKITDNNGFCKKDSFYYSYFKCDTTGFQNTFWSTSLNTLNLHSDTSLLRLDSLKEITCDQSISIPPYKFSYFTGTMPRRLSFGIDHWGFYNGVANNKLLPTYKVKDITGQIIQKDGANRDASWPAMRAGALEKIIYPTGGYTKMEFEPHTTNVNYFNYVATSVWSHSGGYDGHNGYLGDGGGNPFQEDVSFSGNAKQIIISNTNNGISGSYAVLTIQDPNNNYNYVFNSGPVAPGATDTFNIVLTGTTYRVFFHKESATTGYGATAWINDWVSTGVHSNIIVGGLRIKTMTHKDSATSKDIVSKYIYNYAKNDTTGTSSGILYSRPVYVQWLRNKTWDLIYGSALFCNYPHTPYRSPSSVRPMATTQGNHIGYNEVYVLQPGNGYSVYRYYGSNVWDYNVSDVCTRYADWATVCDVNIPFLPAEPLPFEYMRGELKYQANYNQSGQFLGDTWHFPQYVEDSMVTPGHITTLFPNNISTFQEYNLRSAYKVRDSTVSTINDPVTSNYLTTKQATYYNSNYHHQPASTITINSTGDALKTKLKYAFDFRPSNFTTPDSLFYYKNAIHNDSVAMFNRFSGCPSNESYLPLLNSCHKLAFIQFRARMAFARMNYIAYRRRTFTDPGNLYSIAHTSARNAADTELKPIFELQDEYQNDVIEKTQWKGSNLLQANYTKYDTVTNPTGKAYPGKTQLINLASPSGYFTNATVSGNTIAKDSRYTDEANYKYANGRLAEITGKDGVTTSYIWGYSNTLPIVKAVGVNYTTLKAAYDAVGGDLTLLRSQPSLSNAFINTYFYTPGIGMIKETDPRGRNIFYEYDILNRLVLVRDHDNNILKKICYNYAGQPENCLSATAFYNVLASQTFTRNNCPFCQTGSQVTYTVQAGTYSSTVSQAAADQLAQNDIIANGQNYANTNGSCSSSGTVSIAYNNSVNISGFTASYYNQSSGLTYNLTIPANGSGTLGCIPAGTYNLTISKSGNNAYIFFDIGCRSASGTSAFFKGISVSATTCNYVNLGYAD
jgi:hypothetical protein